jgi:hypothetical protein
MGIFIEFNQFNSGHGLVGGGCVLQSPEWLEGRIVKYQKARPDPRGFLDLTPEAFLIRAWSAFNKGLSQRSNIKIDVRQ